MEEDKIWDKIFFVHEYFWQCNLTYDFIIKSYLNFCLEAIPGVDIFAFYSEITNSRCPENIDLKSEKYKNISYLIIDNLRIESLHPILNLKNLIFLYAVRNKIDSIVNLSKFKNLEGLNLEDNNISNIGT